MPISSDILFGLREDHLIAIAHHEGHKFLKALCAPWAKLREAALKEGIELMAISSFRSYHAQETIWNLKATGQRTLLDDQERPIAFDSFNLESDEGQLSLVQTILRWSALPGLSRHHWGTELDVIDAKALKENPNYKVKLTPSEYQRGGIFESLGDFLNEHIPGSEFFRPYDLDLGGVAPEPWHLSHREQAQLFFEELTKERYQEFLATKGQGMALNTVVTKHLDALFERFVFNICD